MQTSLLPDQAECLVSESEVLAAIDQLAAEINATCGNRELIFLTVMNGAMIPASLLAQRLDIPLLMDYLHATRYRNESGTDNLHWIAKPRLDLEGKDVLIFDDILDEGPTLAAIQAYCKEQGANTVWTAVLVEKQHERRIPGVRADFVGMNVPDRYVFGCGMDYRGTLRHLPAIYALPASGK